MLKADVSGGWEELRQEICESLNSILTILTFEMQMGHPGWTWIIGLFKVESMKL